MINKIIITGDVLRPTCHLDGSMEGNQNWNINNRYLLFKHLFATITGLPVEMTYWNSAESFDTPLFYELLKCPLVNELSWFSIYERENLPEKAEQYLLKTFQNAFIIGFELPVILRKFFIRNEIGYINLIDYPIRFLDDTLVGLSTNHSDIFAVIKPYQCEEEGFYIHAALAKIKLHGSGNKIEKDSAVFFGQTSLDLSLYKEGNCLNVLDFEEEILAIAKSHKKFYFKLHPYAGPISGTLNDFITKHNIELISNNAYELLSNDKVKTVVSISSSVLEEAKYFGKNVICLHRMPHRYASRKANEHFDCFLHVPVGSAILLPSFWVNIFKCLHLVKEDNFNDQLSFEAHTFRFSIMGVWGYDKLYKPSAYLQTSLNSINNDINEMRTSNNVETNRLIETINGFKASHVILNENINILNDYINKLNKENRALNFELDVFRKFFKKIHNKNLLTRLYRLFKRRHKGLLFKIGLKQT